MKPRAEEWPPCHYLSNSGTLHPSAKPPCNGDRCVLCVAQPEQPPSNPAGPAASQQPECATCGGSGVLPITGQTAENFQYGGPCPDCAHFNAPTQQATETVSEALCDFCDELSKAGYRVKADAFVINDGEVKRILRPFIQRAITAATSDLQQRLARAEQGSCCFVTEEEFAKMPWQSKGERVEKGIQTTWEHLAEHLSRQTAAQQAEIAALREERDEAIAAYGNWSSLKLNDRALATVMAERDALRAELATTRAQLKEATVTRDHVWAERKELREQLATTRERLAKCEGALDEACHLAQLAFDQLPATEENRALYLRWTNARAAESLAAQPLDGRAK